MTECSRVPGIREWWCGAAGAAARCGLWWMSTPRAPVRTGGGGWFIIMCPEAGFDGAGVSIAVPCNLDPCREAGVTLLESCIADDA